MNWASSFQILEFYCWSFQEHLSPMPVTAFVPHPDSVDDTSYFVSRFSESLTARDNDQNSSDPDSDTTDSFLNSEGHEKLDDCADLVEFDTSPLDLSLMIFFQGNPVVIDVMLDNKVLPHLVGWFS
ncbi:hypothetical protein POM88_007738 [Heracleum sosnowskyi]|uniref:Uncharacterized protein n=1 Tax=Heracleum sosnowskyi TaxID=360622 RepID=A0AAD8N145_9APIA|nr:hypothetical protein POM88_007738 [Heracleum sosnowskyi]